MGVYEVSVPVLSVYSIELAHRVCLHHQVEQAILLVFQLSGDTTLCKLFGFRAGGKETQPLSLIPGCDVDVVRTVTRKAVSVKSGRQ